MITQSRAHNTTEHRYGLHKMKRSFAFAFAPPAGMSHEAALVVAWPIRQKLANFLLYH
jgi:hypothetical protein